MKKLSLVLVLLFCCFIGSTYVKADSGVIIHMEPLKKENGICEYEFSFNQKDYVLTVDLTDTEEIHVSGNNKKFILSGDESFLVNLKDAWTFCPDYLVGYADSNKTKVEDIKILSEYEYRAKIDPNKKNDPNKATINSELGGACYTSDKTFKYYWLDFAFYVGYLDIPDDFKQSEAGNKQECELFATVSEDMYRGKCYVNKDNTETIWLKEDVNVKKISSYKKYKLVSSVNNEAECKKFYLSGTTSYNYSCGKGAVKNIPRKLVEIIRTVVLIVQIGVPIIIIILGMIDIAKGVIAQKEDEMAKGRRIFIKRIVKAILIFLVILIVKTSVRFVNDSIDDSKVTSCIDCFISGRCEY